MNNNSKGTPKLYTLSAIILGYAMLGNYTADEQNAIGNWFMLIGQILETNSAIAQVFEDDNSNNNQYNTDNFPPPSDDEIKKIKQVLNDLLDKLDKMKSI